MFNSGPGYDAVSAGEAELAPWTAMSSVGLVPVLLWVAATAFHAVDDVLGVQVKTDDVEPAPGVDSDAVVTSFPAVVKKYTVNWLSGKA